MEANRKDKIIIEVRTRTINFTVMGNSNLLTSILFTGLLAGTLDILAAIFLLAGGNAVGTFKFIASGVFGKAAFEGGNDMVAWGVLFHFMIALSFTTAYFLMYPKLPFLKRNKWVNAVVYGCIVWAVMNLIVLPMSQVPQRPFNWEMALKNIAILVVCIGLPVAWLGDKLKN